MYAWRSECPLNMERDNVTPAYLKTIQVELLNHAYDRLEEHDGKVPDMVYARCQWTPEMLAYANFVESVSPRLVGYRVAVRYIRDRRIVCGQFHGTSFTVNLAKLSLDDRQGGIGLMLHELAHT